MNEGLWWEKFDRNQMKASVEDGMVQWKLPGTVGEAGGTRNPYNTATPPQALLSTSAPPLTLFHKGSGVTLQN